jgi:hypothetical protein
LPRLELLDGEGNVLPQGVARIELRIARHR